MEKIKKWLNFFADIIYTVSLTTLGYFTISGNTFSLPIYQIVVTVYIVCGVYKYKVNGGWSAELWRDMAKDFLTAVLSIIFLMKISGAIDYNAIASAFAVLINNAMLLLIFFLIFERERQSGAIVYFTYPAGFILALIIIRFGVAPIISLIIGVLIPEPFNYWGYKKKKQVGK